MWPCAHATLRALPAVAAAAICGGAGAAGGAAAVSCKPLPLQHRQRMVMPVSHASSLSHAPAPAPAPGDSCATSFCADASRMMARLKKQVSQSKRQAHSGSGGSSGSKSKPTGGAVSGAAAAAGVAVAATTSSASGGDNTACPTRDSLGRETWTLLHTMAHNYPDNPSASKKAAARAMVQGLAGLYPCEDCRSDFEEEVAKAPPRVESKREFALWVCMQHNTVNKKLNKPTVACNFEELHKRWYTSCLLHDDDDDDDDDDE